MAIALCCFFSVTTAQASNRCDPKYVEVTKNKKVVWSGNAADLFQHYPHGKLGFSNHPERPTVRLSKLIKDIKAEKTGQVIVGACRGKAMKFATADIVKGDLDIWLVPLRSGDIRLFEYKRGEKKPKHGIKRINRIDFIDH